MGNGVMGNGAENRPAMSAVAGAGLAVAGLSALRGARLLFRGLDLRLAPGAMLSLVGPNGSGKSTLLRLLAGLSRPAAGRILWQGRSIGDEPEDYAAQLHYLGHRDAVRPGLSVAEHLAFYARLLGGDVGRGLDCFDLARLADLPGRFLSAGQRRRLGLARLAVAARPLWLLDEPTVGLDSAGVAEFQALARGHLAGGGLIVAATHLDLGLPGASLAPADHAPGDVPPELSDGPDPFDGDIAG